MILSEIKSQFIALCDNQRIDVESVWPWVRDHFIHDRSIVEDLQEDLHVITRALNKGAPIQYALGWAPFMNLILHVDTDVLIPRSETEELVFKMQTTYPRDYAGLILDVGTGSGAIAIVLALHFKEARVVATDLSDDALAVARKNAHKYDVHIEFIQDDFLAPISAIYTEADIIVSNPPYISKSEQPEMDDTVIIHEPDTALYGPDQDPLMFYKLLAERYSNVCDIWVEMNALQHQEISASFLKHNTNVEVYDDLQDLPRMLFSRKPS